MRVITTPSCEVKPNSGEPQACMMPYNCGYCAGEIKKGEWISKGRAIGDTSWYTIHTSHTADVDQLQGVERCMWLTVPDVVPDSAIVTAQIASAVMPRYSDPMSEDEALAHARRGSWIVCITPDKQRNRRYVVAE
jgi:hypothetical protein